MFNKFKHAVRQRRRFVQYSSDIFLFRQEGARAIKRKVKDSEIDFSDIPELDETQLAKFKQRGRPVIGESPRKAISIRIEETVLEKLKAKAKKKGVAYQTLINDILKKAV